MGNKKQISIPIPDTRFIFIAEEQKDNSWNIFLFDPDSNKKEEIKKDVSSAMLSLYSSLALKTDINKNN